jgi:hypothetical protein
MIPIGEILAPEAERLRCLQWAHGQNDRPLTRREMMLELFCPASWRSPARGAPRAGKLPDSLIQQFVNWGR